MAGLRDLHPGMTLTPGPGTSAPGAVRHQLALRNRESLSIEGVTNVESFDDEEVALETTEGILVVRGEGLHIREFNIEKATLSVNGLIRSLEYVTQGGEPKARGFLARLFR
ncbi:MAG TPA: sporulation protein YabP [Firmicutes bacterium]|nr:sporulation protein YabP [Bacillota bacterium]